MEKVNFNFDQLLLAGGGPPGPIGPIGLEGPAGPQGDPGNKWYVGCTAELIDLIPSATSLYGGDLFLSQGTACSPTSPYGPLGQVWRYNDTSGNFDDTGLNLRGPQGQIGATGTNTSWDVYEGVLNGGNLATDPWSAGVNIQIGPTNNFHILKGDGFDFPDTGGSLDVLPTSAGATIGTGRSRDTLWLGGVGGAQQILQGNYLGDVPKLYIEPRTLQSYDPSTLSQIENDSGIKIGCTDPNILYKGTGAPLDTLYMSYSNISIDDALNLRISNFTSFGLVSTGQLGVNTNNISIESASRVQLLGTGSGAEEPKSEAQIQIGTNLYFGEVGGTPSKFDDGGSIISTIDTSGDEYRHLISTNDKGITQIYGGGNVNWVYYGEPQIKYPNLLLGSKEFAKPYTIGFKNTENLRSNPEEFFTDDVGNSISTKSGYIQYGPMPDSTEYSRISLGTRLGEAQIQNVQDYRPSFHVHNKNVTINELNDIDFNWSNTYSFGLDAGNIRLRSGGSLSTQENMIVNKDADGTFEWQTINDMVNNWFADNSGNESHMTFWATDTDISSTDGGPNASNNNKVIKYDDIGWQFLDGNEGAGKVLMQDSSQVSGYIKWDYASGVSTTLFTNAGNAATFTPSPQAKSFEIHCIGGGGGGGGGAYKDELSGTYDMVTGGAGGGGGAYTKTTIPATSANKSSTWTIYVGVGGNGGAGAGQIGTTAIDGGDGQTSWVKTGLSSSWLNDYSSVSGEVDDSGPTYENIFPGNYVLQAGGGQGGEGGQRSDTASSGGWNSNTGKFSPGRTLGGRPGFGVYQDAPNSDTFNIIGSNTPGWDPTTIQSGAWPAYSQASSQRDLYGVQQEQLKNNYWNMMCEDPSQSFGVTVDGGKNAVGDGNGQLNKIVRYYAGNGGGYKMFYPKQNGTAVFYLGDSNIENPNDVKNWPIIGAYEGFAPCSFDQPTGGGAGGVAVKGYIVTTQTQSTLNTDPRYYQPGQGGSILNYGILGGLGAGFTASAGFPQYGGFRELGDYGTNYQEQRGRHGGSDINPSTLQPNGGVITGAGGGGGTFGNTDTIGTTGDNGGAGGNGGLFGGGGGGGGPKLKYSVLPNGTAVNNTNNGNVGNACVVGDTVINTFFGQKYAKEVKVGDSVLSWDNVSQSYEFAKVIGSKTKLFDSTLKITTESGKTIQCSEEHGFYISLEEELLAEDLIEGVTKIFVKNGTKMKLDLVTKIETIEGEIQTYNFTVEGTKSYISNDIVSHNYDLGDFGEAITIPIQSALPPSASAGGGGKGADGVVIIYEYL